MSSRKSAENLTPSQMKVKQPRPVRYVHKGVSAEMKKKYRYIEPEEARQIITLYMVCGLGYSPIRQVMGYDDDKKIEDVIRQHMLGRGKVDAENGELHCPPINPLTEKTTKMIYEISEYRGTLEDPYVKEMFKIGRWWDEPARAKEYKCECGYVITDQSFDFCPRCGKEVDKPEYLKHKDEPEIRTLFDIGD